MKARVRERGAAFCYGIRSGSSCAVFLSFRSGSSTICFTRCMVGSGVERSHAAWLLFPFPCPTSKRQLAAAWSWCGNVRSCVFPRRCPISLHHYTHAPPYNTRQLPVNQAAPINCVIYVQLHRHISTNASHCCSCLLPSFLPSFLPSSKPPQNTSGGGGWLMKSLHVAPAAPAPCWMSISR